MNMEYTSMLKSPVGLEEPAKRKETSGNNALLIDDKMKSADYFEIPFIRNNVDNQNLPKSSLLSNQISSFYSDGCSLSPLNTTSSNDYFTFGTGSKNLSSMGDSSPYSLSPNHSLFKKPSYLSCGECLQEPSLSLYDTCLPNLQDVMDNEFSSSTHYMPTPTTISSVSPFIQKSYDYSYSRPSFSSERITYSPVPEIDKEYTSSFTSTPQPPLVYDDISYSPILSDTLNDNTTKSSSSPYESIKGHIVEMAKDHLQCRYLQQVLNQLSYIEINEVYKEIRSNLVELMMDPFGIYLFQKLLELSTDDRILDIVHQIHSSFVQIACDTHGTRSIQYLINSTLHSTIIQEIMQALKNHVISLSMHVNGNHVIQCCLSVYPNYYCQVIYEEVMTACYDLSSHRYGCCVMQRCFLTAPLTYRQAFFMMILHSANELINHPYGNYVIQFVLENGTRSEIQNLSQCVLGSVVKYSCQKYSSNVIEKIVILGDAFLHQLIINELIQSNQFPTLLHHSFANYVIQRLLTVCNDKNRKILCDAILPYESQLCKSTGGRHILSLLQNMPERAVKFC